MGIVIITKSSSPHDQFRPSGWATGEDRRPASFDGTQSPRWAHLTHAPCLRVALRRGSGRDCKDCVCSNNGFRYTLDRANTYLRERWGDRRSYVIYLQCVVQWTTMMSITFEKKWNIALSSSLNCNAYTLCPFDNCGLWILAYLRFGVTNKDTCQSFAATYQPSLTHIA